MRCFALNDPLDMLMILITSLGQLRGWTREVGTEGHEYKIRVMLPAMIQHVRTLHYRRRKNTHEKSTKYQRPVTIVMRGQSVSRHGRSSRYTTASREEGGEEQGDKRLDSGFRVPKKSNIRGVMCLLCH
ncbi:hypothetical protein E2C01_037664 [Portunus trituberculatus]|uniref:Uncharacterized protein n=1 Tax=Portunus trituberculatus TaxID=210409 RepID=A0A5B7FEM5_PORTR|nr:hypothetical protein [Portunus trituberculatus]